MIRAISIALTALLFCISANATIINGDFSDGLNGWTPIDDVSESTGSARLGDDSFFGASTLYQAAAAGLGETIFEFDFLPSLSSEYDFAPDFLASTLYFTNDIDTFDIFGGSYDDVQWLMDVDSTGNLIYEGSVSDSDLGGGWQHYSYQFDNTYAYIAPVFDLLDFNILVDSSVLLDNVKISRVVAVAAPPSLPLLLLGVLLLVYIRRKALMSSESED